MAVFRSIRTFWSKCKVINKLLICYVFTVFIPLVISFVVLIFRANASFEQEILQEKKYLLEQTAGLFGESITQTEYIKSTIEGNSELMLYFTGSYRTASEEVAKILHDIYPMFKRFTLTSGMVQDIQTFRYRSSFIRYLAPYVIDASLSPYGEERLREMRFGEKLIIPSVMEGNIYLEIVEPIFIDGLIVNVGACQCTLDVTELLKGMLLQPTEDMVLELGDTYIFINGEDRAVRQIDAEEFYQIQGRRVKAEVESMGLKLFLIVDGNMFFDNPAVFWLIPLFSLLLILLTLLYYAIPIVLIRPVVKLSEHMDKEAGNKRIRPANIPHEMDEVGALIESFNRLACQNGELNDQIVRELTLRQQSDYYALQSQIKPHFVFNVLQKVNMLVFLDQKSEAINLLQKFGDFLRYSICRSSDMGTLAGEIAHTKRYLEMLEGEGKKFDMSVCVADDVDTTTLRTPQFILQPIAENAIKYNRSQGVKLFLSVQRQGEYALVEMRNDGKPIDKLILQEINEKLIHNTTEILKNDGEQRSGIGLVNINTRLRYFYGNDCGLRLSNTENGVSVLLKIKLLSSESVRGEENEDLADR